jgi:filamentous hemagglutinin family protein
MQHMSKKQLQKYILSTLAVGLFSLASVAYALPVQDTTHGNVGGATIDTNTASKMGITSSSANNVMNWKSFSIANGETVQFDAKNYLNLVRGTSKSEINGALNGTGNIYLINPNGILFGAKASVNVGNLVASTRAIDKVDADGFAANGTSPLATAAKAADGDIVNLGKLQTASLTLEGNNITIQNAADITSNGTTALTGTVTAKAAGIITVGHEVTETTTRSFNINDKTGKSTNITVHVYKNATVAASGYTVTDLAGTAKSVKESMLVYNVYDLQNMDTNLSGNYMLANDIDATSTNTWNWNSYKNIYKGFQPMNGIYKGTFDGAGHVITGLTANLVTAGLFTMNMGVIQNVGFVDGSVTGGSSSSWIGGVVGINYSVINNVYNTGTVSSTIASSSIGGVAGYNSGSIVNTHNEGMVSGTGSSANIGGVAGTIDSVGTITNSYNTGAVSGTGANSNIGGVSGLVGNKKSGSIVNSYNTGTVSGTGASSNIGGVAGLVGKTVAGTITESYNTGTVSGAEGYTEVGGVAGKIMNASTITDSHNEGTVHMDKVSHNDVGGIVGVNESSGSVARVYNSGEVSIGVGSYGNVGGVMGNNKGTGSITDSYNMGKVYSENGNASITIGGVAGLNASGSITKVYNTGEISSKNTSSFSKGGVVGKNVGGVITNVYNTGSLTDNGVAGYYSSIDGGVVGYNQGTITNAYNTGAVNSLGASSESNNYTGGVVGLNYKNAKITNVYNTGSVSGTYDVGGVIGQNDGEATATLANAYNTGAVSSTGSTDKVGGVVGENVNNATITNTLWAKDLVYTPTTGIKPTQAVGNQADLDTVKGETLANMKKAATYDKWTDTSGNKIVASEGGKGTAWRIYEGNTTPLLTSFFKGVVTVAGLSNKSAAYSGTAQTADISSATYDPADIDTSHIYAGGGRNAGTYSAIYSDQQGYDLVNTNTLKISPKKLTATLTGKTGNTYAFTKAYDGTDSVTKNLVLGTTYTFGDQVISGDTVSIDAAKAVGAYAGKNVGDDKTISYNGITLTGADAGNYTIDGTLSGNVGQITKKDITASLNGSYVFTKTYDGNTDVKQALGNNYSFATGDVEKGDKVSLTAGVGAYTDKNVGDTKEITFGNLVLGGDAAGNYNLTTESLTGNVGQITTKELTITLAGNNTFTKEYDGTATVNQALAGNYTISGIVGTEKVDIDSAGVSGTYADKNAADGKLVQFTVSGLTGADKGNYSLTSTTLTGNVGKITPKALDRYLDRRQCLYQSLRRYHDSSSQALGNELYIWTASWRTATRCSCQLAAALIMTRTPATTRPLLLAALL